MSLAPVAGRLPAAVLARCRAVAAPVAASRRRDVPVEALPAAALGRGDVPGCRDVLNFVLPALFWLRMIIKEAFRVQRFCTVKAR